MPPKRQAATKARSAIIEISDNDSEVEEEYAPPAKKSKTKAIDNAAKKVANADRLKVIHAKNNNKAGSKRTGRNSKNAQAVEEICTAEDDTNQNVLEADTNDGQCMSSSGSNNNNRALNQVVTQERTSTGRSSFWARRKVWNIHELLAETENIAPTAARNIVNLFENENTIPFICRYRRDLVDHITPERLRDIKNSYTEIVNLRKKAEHIVVQLEKENVINEDVRTEMLCAKTAEELEYLYAPYKPASKGSLAERAKALGLEVYADRLLYGDVPKVNVHEIVDPNNDDLNSVCKVLNGICNIISHNISKHTGVLEELRKMRKIHRILLESKKSKQTKKPSTAASTTKATAVKKGHQGKNEESKYQQYFEFQCDVRYLKPHQVLALNRAEKQKFLSVKIVTPDYLKKDIKNYIQGIFMTEGLQYELRREVFEKSFEECFTKKLQPFLSRQIRSDLNEAANKAAIEVFAKNLKQLLLMSPLKGERILGIDPGFVNGCKLGLISETAEVLETAVYYLHTRDADPELYGEKLAKLLAKHNCKVIALGNGTACRETEFWLSKLFEVGILDSRTVHYSIVSEQGASIYSCSAVAKKEFPDMDTNLISAVSIARRLNDPLSEYVKIEPRHIGVGMYQHDVNEKTLNESLSEVVSECVSYVGVDINTASLSVLKHVAGLTEKKAEKIIEHRIKNGPFHTRKDLLQVKSIGEKTFVQCAGFIRIEPRSLGGSIPNLLDCTWVHPESYDIARKIISNCKLNLNDIGTEDFIRKIKSYSVKIDELAEDFKIPKERLEIVFLALQRGLFQDYRSDFDKKPLFKQGITRLTDLSEGDVVTGAVSNVTHFGAFVDIGVECDGLIHVSQMKNVAVNIGDRVTASIVNVDVGRKRIGLRLQEQL